MPESDAACDARFATSACAEVTVLTTMPRALLACLRTSSGLRYANSKSANSVPPGRKISSST
jgi:hypothetical protein